LITTPSTWLLTPDYNFGRRKYSQFRAAYHSRYAQLTKKEQFKCRIKYPLNTLLNQNSLKFKSHEADAKWISENIPNTRMIHLGQGIHFIQEDHPEKIGSEISDWYATL
jgi:hypothetical protein